MLLYTLESPIISFKSLNISAHRFTKTAREKIEKAGGTATVIIKTKGAPDVTA